MTLRKNSKGIWLSEYLQKPDRLKYEVINGMICEKATKRHSTYLKIQRSVHMALELAQPHLISYGVLSSDFILLLKNDDDNAIALNPDFCIVEPDAIAKDGVYEGIPKAIVEIIHPDNGLKNYITKRKIYEQYKIQEYWIIDPQHTFLQIFLLNENGKYDLVDYYSIDDKVYFTSVKSKAIMVRSLFENFNF